MKVYSCPTEVPLPEPDYRNYNHDKVIKEEAKHQEALRTHLISIGYKGPATGKIYRTQVADGYAQYMLADGGRSSCLIHLAYGDGYQSRDVEHLPKKVILQRIEADERMTALWRKKS
jgi:hypothetical protein